MPLHTNAIVYEIHKKLFNEVLPDLIYKSYHADVKQNTQLLCVEMGYELAEKLLPNILNEQQADCVAAAKCLSVENERWAIRFAYTRGMFAGFEQTFTPANAERVFQKRVRNQIMRMPNMQRYKKYYKRREQITDLFKAARKDLSKTLAEQIKEIEFDIQERLCALARHAFYIGYRYALSIVDIVQPARYCITPRKLLITEHDLGFTKTVEERELYGGSYIFQSLDNESPLPDDLKKVDLFGWTDRK